MAKPDDGTDATLLSAEAQALVAMYASLVARVEALEAKHESGATSADTTAQSLATLVRLSEILHVTIDDAAALMLKAGAALAKAGKAVN